jgi:hypothetical protein
MRTTKPALATMFVHDATNSHRGKNKLKAVKLLRFFSNHLFIQVASIPVHARHLRLFDFDFPD